MTPGPGSGERAQATSRGRHAAMLALVALVVLALYHTLLTREPLRVHDSLDTYLRADGYLRELAAGHVPPQLFADAISGGGYALPRFYPPLGYVVAAALAAGAGDLVLGVHLALVLSVILSGWAMYYFAHALTGRVPVALLGAILYVTFPYRFTDVLQRSAVAESWTFVWFPLLFAGAWEAIRRGRVPWYFGALRGRPAAHPHDHGALLRGGLRGDRAAGAAVRAQARDAPPGASRRSPAPRWPGGSCCRRPGTCRASGPGTRGSCGPRPSTRTRTVSRSTCWCIASPRPTDSTSAWDCWAPPCRSWRCSGGAFEQSTRRWIHGSRASGSRWRSPGWGASPSCSRRCRR